MMPQCINFKLKLYIMLNFNELRTEDEETRKSTLLAECVTTETLDEVNRPMTDKEVSHYREILASESVKLKHMKTEKEEAMKEFKEKMDPVAKNIKETIDAIDKNEVFDHNVETFLFADHHTKMMLYVDKNADIIKRRPLTMEERQTHLTVSGRESGNEKIAM